MTPPLLLDLFCGLGGWTRAAQRQGWNAIGYDTATVAYPGRLIQRPLPLPLKELLSHRPTLITASPPCEEYARHHLPWLKGPPPDLSLLAWCIDSATVSPVPWVIECSRFAARHFPGARFVGSYALWGKLPALLPSVPRLKMKTSGTDPARRALIPSALADWIITTAR